MSCGDIQWWNSPDPKALLERHGKAEHLVVQIDFLVQVQRDGRAEYSIPGASKSGSGQTGFADIVSIATGEIWEIKPENLETEAVKESYHYTKFAKAGCGVQWQPGKSYSASGHFGPGIVYRLEGNGNKAELLAFQGRPGAVLYKWRINGSEVPSLIPFFAWAIREQIVKTFFPGGPKALTGAKPPNNLPPGKFKPPVLTPDGCIPQLGGFIPALIRAIRTSFAQTVIDNSSVLILVSSATFNRLVGAGIVARQVAMLQVKSDPAVTLYRKALMTLTAAAVAHGAIAALYYGGWVILEAVELLGGAGGVLGLTGRVAGAGTVVSEGAFGSLAAGLQSAFLRTAVPVGATVVAFAIPRASRADPGTPVAFDVSPAKYIAIPPGGSVPRVGQGMSIDGGDWIVAGIAKTPPD